MAFLMGFRFVDGVFGKGLFIITSISWNYHSVQFRALGIRKIIINKIIWRTSQFDLIVMAFFLLWELIEAICSRNLMTSCAKFFCHLYGFI